MIAMRGVRWYLLAALFFILVTLLATLSNAWAMAIWSLLGFVVVSLYVILLGFANLSNRVKAIEDKLGGGEWTSNKPSE